MNIKEIIFEKKKDELLSEFRDMISAIQFFVDKKEDLIITYVDSKKDFFIYHSNKFIQKYKNEKVVYILKNWAKRNNIDYSNIYEHIYLTLLENSKEDIKNWIINELYVNNEDFDKFYDDFLFHKDDWNQESIIKMLVEKNPFFWNFINNFFYTEYLLENSKNPNLVKMEKFIKKLKYKDIF